MLKREEEKYEPILKRIKNFVLELDDLIFMVSQKKMQPEDALIATRQLLHPEEVRSLPSEFQDLKNRIVLQLRRLALSIWTSFQQYAPVFETLRLARGIDADASTLTLLDKDEERYHELIVQQEILQEKPKKTYLSIALTAAIVLFLLLLFYFSS